MIELFHPKSLLRLFFYGLYPSSVANAFSLASNVGEAKTHHLYHLAKFFSDLQRLGYVVDDFGSEPSCSRSIAVFLDVPRDRTLAFQIISSTDTAILVLSEHPFYQPSFWKDFASCVGIVIHSYDLPATLNCSRSFNSLTSFAYRDLPDCTGSMDSSAFNEGSSCLQGATYSASIFCSNLVSPAESLYGFRRHLINASSSIYGSKFLHCGRGWVYPKKPKGLARQVKDFIAARRNGMPIVSLDSYHGSPPSKALLSCCKTSYAVENFLEPLCYTTEKPLEALSHGCIPIYVGSRDRNWLSKFLCIHSASSLEVLSSVSSYSSNSINDTKIIASSLRASISDFLRTSEQTSLAILYSLIIDFED